MKIFDLHIEGQRNPLGMKLSSPRFSWKFLDTPRGFTQETFRIQVSGDLAFHNMIWDSGVVSDSQSHLVEYRGVSLHAGRRYWVRVRASGGGEKTEEWCAPEWFEFAPSKWRSAFIAVESDSSARSSAVRLVRKDFFLPFAPKTARLYATALGTYRADLNGKPVSDAILAPGWTSYDQRLAFQCYDIGTLVVRGNNEIRCLVSPGWYKGFLGWRKQRNLYGKRLALSAWMEIVGESGQRMVFETDGSWESSASPWSCAELYHGEVYDARLEDCEEWEPVEVIMPPKAVILPQEWPSVRPQGELWGQPIKTPDGMSVFDFGRNISGVVRIVAHGPQGSRIVIRHAETLDRFGNVYYGNLRSARQTIDYTLSGKGAESFAPQFCTMGFRYIVVEQGIEFLDQTNLTAVVYHSDFEPGMEFECSHSGISKLHENILWGWKGNAVDVPTDCPQRDERLGWTGDAQVFASTALRLTKSDLFFRKWLGDLRSDQHPDGAVPLVVPDVLSRFRQPKNEPIMGPPHTAAGWSDAAVVVPWEVYRATGDVRVLRESFQSMLAWVNRVRDIAGERLIWNQSPQLGDWLALDAKEGSFFGATPTDLVATACFARSVELVAKAARALGKNGMAKEYRVLHGRILKAFQDEFLTANGRVAAPTQTAHALILAWELCPGSHRQRIVDDLASLLGQNNGHLTTGFLGTPVLCDALSGAGRSDLAYALLLKEDYPSWLYQVGRGATTVWEHWDGMKPDGTMWNPKMNSFNHYAYGAVGDWMYRTIGGIRLDPDVPAYRRTILRPKPEGGITWARHTVETPYGSLSMSWEINGDILKVQAMVPPNTTACLMLPDGEKELGAGSWTEECIWPQ